MKIHTQIFLLVFMAAFLPQVIRAQSATAVMEVRVEIISGSSLTSNSQGSAFNFTEGGNSDSQTYGEYNISLPEGAEILASSENSLTLSNGSDEWVINSKMEQENRNGTVNLRFKTDGEKSGSKKGVYKGVQVATIEYL